MKYILSILAITLLVTSCSNKDSLGEAQALYNESMKVHDEIMPRMDELFTLRQKLTLKLDSLKGDSVVNATSIEQIRKAITDLAAADKDMMDWMHNIKDVGSDEGHEHHGTHNEPTSELNPDEILKVQKEQKEAIERNRTDIETSIAKARELLRAK